MPFLSTQNRLSKRCNLYTDKKLGMETAMHTETFTKSKRMLRRFILASLLIHLSFSFVHMKDIEFFKALPQPEPEQKIMLKILNQAKSRQIVQTVEANKKKPTETKYLSRTNNSYERQTRTQHVGKFTVANKGVRTAVSKKQETAEEKTMAKKFEKIKFSDLAVKNNERYAIKKKVKKSKRAMQTLGLKSGKRTGKDLGASSDFLEDVPLGDFTKLNTQEYEFYGFYHRIREKLEQFWGNNIQEEAEKIYKQGRSIASESNLITGLTIKINSRGEIVDIILKSTSGIKELDDAAVKAFNQAGPFPNPPKGMIKNDGKATIEWGFVVNT